ncbi:MAG: gamma-glutamyltransferase, partial [Iamia sp.]
MVAAVPTTHRWPTTYSTGGMVCSVDHLASSAGAEILAAGGSAVDAAVATSAVLAVTTPHMCGMGGDLFALVHHQEGPPEALDAAGRAGSGADADRLRAEGHDEIPFHGDVRAAPVPGCVDGWCALLDRHGRLPPAQVLDPAHRLAEGGFPAAPMLAFMLADLDGVEDCDELARARPEVGERVLRPELARTLAAVADGGRDGFYAGSFGAALVEVGAGEYHASDLRDAAATWVDPLGLRAWGHDLWTIPPVSQGYIALASAWMAERLGGDALPAPDDATWAHLMVEVSRLAAADRPEVLHEEAEGSALLDPARLAVAAARFNPDRAMPVRPPTQGDGNMRLTVVERDGTSWSADVSPETLRVTALGALGVGATVNL